MSDEYLFDAEPAGGEFVPDDATTLTGTLRTVTFRNEENGYTVARLDVEGEREPITIVGVLPDVAEGDTMEVAGRWKQHPTYGRQLDVERSALRPPSGRTGLVKFLGGGRIKGVGPKTAEKIVDALGLDVLERLRRNPELLATVPGVSRGKAAAVIAQLREQEAASAALVFLQDNGLGPTQALRVFKRYGEDTVATVRENPWRLAEDVVGIGFRIADALARQLGHEVDSAARIAAGLRHLLSQASFEGHVGLPAETLGSSTAEVLGVDLQLVEMVLVEQLHEGRLEEDGLVYLPELLRAERSVGQHVRRLLDDAAPLVDLPPEAAVEVSERRNAIHLADDQRRALATALSTKISVITGGPGVGKTTIVRCLLDILLQEGRRVALAAPTGRAARRLAEATGQEASTLHRLLGITPVGSSFALPHPEPLDVDVLVVDETSMVDMALMAAVVASLPAQAGLVLVGDVDQLPSVGPGAVLRSFIDSRVVPVALLSTIFRQDELSGIVRVAHELNEGERPTFDEGPDGEAYFVEREEAADVLTAIRALVTERIPKRFGLDPLRDVQVLTPVHGGPLGTQALNESLRAVLNPPHRRRAEIERFGKLYREGDKLMQVRNNYELNVFNGDVGLLRRIAEEDGVVTVEFDGRRVDYGLDGIDQLEPAFAITCHKSQGSEFPAVVLPLVASHTVMLRRNLVYTAFTRAKQALVAVGQTRALNAALRSSGPRERHSRLAERLAGEA